MNGKQKLEQQATPKQLNLIETLTQKRYKGENLTIKQASIMISKLLEPQRKEREMRNNG